MEFGNTYIFLFGLKVFEPMVLLTNIIFCIFCILFYLRLNKFKHGYSQQMARFLLALGISSIFGATGHAVQMQLGNLFFEIILFLMNLTSLLGIYFCFRSAYTYSHLNKPISKMYIYFVIFWITGLLIACGVHGNFLLIKIHAGITLIYSLIVHYLNYKKEKDKGSERVVLGILISFVPILVHTFKFSLGEWFNYKDIAHTIMIVSLTVIYMGAKTISERLQGFVGGNSSAQPINI
jgi:hypothetical protein